jgi:hypothetical protein
MKDPEDEAFEQLALKQGQREHTSGWRKKQIMEQAFPNPHRTDQTGITRREYFAAKAMQGMLASGNLPKTMPDADLAECAYALADAMLKAREA